MLHSTFTSAVARGGSSGGSDYSREFFNFPMTIASAPPTNPSQGVREGHVWLVMTQDQKNTLHNIVFDAYSQTVVYQPGTLVIIVPRFGNNRVYVNQTKNTGESATPLVYSTSDDLETLWPVTVVSDNQIQVKMEISKPWQYAKLITPSSFDNIPLYYFNGKAWEAPRTWDYIYWSDSGDGTRWQAYQMNTETFTPIKENMPDFDLNPIVQTILSSENKATQPYISVMSKGGFAVLGMECTVNGNQIKRMNSETVQWWQYQPEWYFLKINKRGASYLGKCTLTPYPNEYPFVAMGIRNAIENQVDYEATDFCIFLQTRASDAATEPSYLYFRRYYFDETSGTMKYTDTNKVPLVYGLMGASFDVNSRDSGFIAYSSGISKQATSTNGNYTFWIAEFSIKDNILTISEPKFGSTISVYRWPYNNIFNMSVYEDIIYISAGAGTATNSKSTYCLVRQSNRILGAIVNQYAQAVYTCTFATPKEDKSEFITVNSGGIFNRYTINKTNPNNYVFNLIESVNKQPPYYQRDYVLPMWEKRIPGPRDDTFIWYQNSIAKQNPNNENMTLPVDQIGVGGMISKSQCGSGVNMAIASLLKP